MNVHDAGPVPFVDVTQTVSATATVRTVTLMNGLGEPVLAFDQNGSGSWVIHGWTERDIGNDAPSMIRAPWFGNEDPVTVATTGSPPAVQSSRRVVPAYDVFGRNHTASEITSMSTTEVYHHVFHPLAVVTQDAEQLQPGSAHYGGSVTRSFDGHGRVVSVGESLGTFNATTALAYHATGEPYQVTRSGSGGYVRQMDYDTFGRLTLNREPNTSKPGSTFALHYMWDDADRLVATSDARGCGENLVYDGIGRLLAEDYSPCLASHAPYTPAPEVQYTYDAYDPDQMESDGTFLELDVYAIGQLTAIRDRGSHTRFNYDARGRLRRIGRRIAKPLSVLAGGPTDYASHWFKSRRDFDLGDRLSRRTTGAEGGALNPNGTSEENYAYSARGLLASLGSSYRPILSSVAYDPEGTASQLVYGDQASTAITVTRDDRHRLSELRIERPSAGPWAAASATYTLPPDESTIPQVPAWYKFLNVDHVGNPGIIQDAAQLVVPDDVAAVAQRQLTYNDRYQVTSVAYTYATGNGAAPWRSPYQAEVSAGDPSPVPLRTLATRVASQSFAYDEQGNTTAATDDTASGYDRGLGPAPTIAHGAADDGPNQLRTADGMSLAYDDSGNLIELRLERGGQCPSGLGDDCSQFFAYDWDEVGELARARRWDFPGSSLPVIPAGTVPTSAPSWDLAYAYSGGVRVSKEKVQSGGTSTETVDVFDTLRLRDTTFDEIANDYAADYAAQRVFVGDSAEVFLDQVGLPNADPTTPVHVFYAVGDHLGSSSMIIDGASSEMVERTTYQPYGAIESDFRPDRWAAFREDFKFTGKEEDIEVGLTYFGARYYAPYLGRFASADPLTIHGLGGDLNPYAYVGGRVMSDIDPFGLAPCTPEGSGTCDVDDKGTQMVQDGPNSYSYVEPGTGERMIDETAQDSVGTPRDISDFAQRGVDAIARTATRPYSLPGGGSTFTPSEYEKGAVNHTLDEVESMGRMLSPLSTGSYFVNRALGVGSSPRFRITGGPDDISDAVSGGTVFLGSLAISVGTAASGPRSFTARNFRANLTRVTGGAPPGYQAHHVFPQKFVREFEKLGINIHDPRFGAWWEAASHQEAARAYNAAWEAFFASNPSAEQAMQFGRQISAGYGLQIFF